MITLKGRTFEHFYTVLWTDEVAEAVLHTLATLGGRFALEQREIAVAWCNRTTGAEGWNRSQVFRHWRDALAYLRKDCLNVNFGAIFGTTLPTVPENEGPRYWERIHVFPSGAGTPRGEMVLDVDLADPPYSRTGVCDCGNKRQACAVCWKTFMVPAQRVMSALLSQQLGMKRWFAVFSGRRGLHYWLCDDRVLQMTKAQRKLFVETLAKPPTIHSEWGREVAQMLGGGINSSGVDSLWPKIDAPVGADATHLHGVPLTLHPDTKIFRQVLRKGELFDFATQRRTVDDLTPTFMKQQRELLLQQLLEEE